MDTITLTRDEQAFLQEAIPLGFSPKIMRSAVTKWCQETPKAAPGDDELIQTLKAKGVDISNVDLKAFRYALQQFDVVNLREVIEAIENRPWAQQDTYQARRLANILREWGWTKKRKDGTNVWVRG